MCFANCDKLSFFWGAFFGQYFGSCSFHPKKGFLLYFSVSPFVSPDSFSSLFLLSILSFLLFCVTLLLFFFFCFFFLMFFLFLGFVVLCLPLLASLLLHAKNNLSNISLKTSFSIHPFYFLFFVHGSCLLFYCRSLFLVFAFLSSF